MKNLFSDNGISVSNAGYLSNLANKLAVASTNELKAFKAFSSTINVAGVEKPYTTSNVFDSKIILSTLNEIGDYYSLVALIRTATKVKEGLIKNVETDIRKKNPLILPEFEYEQLLEIPKAPVKASIEEYFLTVLSLEEYSKYLKHEAHASHIGQFIHNDGHLQNMLKEAQTKALVDWVKQYNEIFVVSYTAAAKKVDLVNLHAKLAEMHRKHEAKVNYYKANYENWATDKLNVDTSVYKKELEEVYAKNRDISARNHEKTQEVAKLKSDYEATISKMVVEEKNKLRKMHIAIPDELRNVVEKLKNLVGGENL